MKILGSEDYYDYVANIYGVDSHVILDRRDGIKIGPPSDFGKSLFMGEPMSVAFCGTLYFGMYMCNGKTYWGEQMLELGELVPSKKTWSGAMTIESVKIKEYEYRRWHGNYRKWDREFPYLPMKTKLNDEHNCPIIYMIGDVQYNRNPNIIKFPNRLKDIGFARNLDPDSAYRELYGWVLNRMKDKDFDLLNDDEKVVAKGFDKRASFRHRK